MILALLLACTPAPPPAAPPPPDESALWADLHWTGHLGGIRRASAVPATTWEALRALEADTDARFAPLQEAHTQAGAAVLAALAAGKEPDAATVDALVQADAALRALAVDTAIEGARLLGPADEPGFAPEVAPRVLADGVVEMMLRGHPGSPTPELAEGVGLGPESVEIAVLETRRAATLDAALLRYQTALGGPDTTDVAGSLRAAAAALGEELNADKRERLRLATRLFAGAPPEARAALVARPDVRTWLDALPGEESFPLAYGMPIGDPGPGEPGAPTTGPGAAPATGGPPLTP